MKILVCLLCLATAFDHDDYHGMALLQVTQSRMKANHSLPNEAQLSKVDDVQTPELVPKRHRVEHIPLLSEQSFWWMMAVVIILVTVVVIRTDAKDETMGEQAEDAHLRAERTFEADQGNSKARMEGNPSSPEAEVAIAKRERAHSEEFAKEMQTYYSFESMQKLAFCFIALNTSMILWGIAQEFIMTNVYRNRDGEVMQLPSPLFLVLCNRMTTMLYSALLLWIRNQPLFFSGTIDALAPAVSNTCASWAQYSSLGYISFGLQTTAKSIKILPVVLISSLRGKTHGVTDYAECMVLACACFVFGQQSEAETGYVTTTTGVILLAGYLICDSLTPHFQDILFQKHQEIDVVQATLAMSSIAVVMMLVEMTLTLKLFQSITFLWQCPEAALHMLVLSLASTLTQYMISYTIKHFGPVVFTIISSTRQVISVLISAALFSHHISGLALTAMVIMFGTLMVRALRPLAKDHKELSNVEPEDYQRVPLLSFAERLSTFSPLFVCTTAIHIVYLIYTLLQEFLSTHTFDGNLFNYPLVLVGVSHTAGAILSVAALRIGGHEILVKGLWHTILPGSSDLVATSLQHAALYKMYFPAQSLMKTLKVLPVMVVGTCLQNRSYSRLDYAEGLLLSCLVAFFVWDFQINQLDVEENRSAVRTSALGIAMMAGYVLVDSFTSNLQDSIYQKLNLQPGHMLLGMETFSALFAWIFCLVSGELSGAISFVLAEPNILLFLGIFGLTAAVGSLACVLTVRLFGPAVFTLIMTSRAILSLLLSVLFFQHAVDTVDCVSLVAVSIITLMSSTRRVSAQMRQLRSPCRENQS